MPQLSTYFSITPTKRLPVVISIVTAMAVALICFCLLAVNIESSSSHERNVPLLISFFFQFSLLISLPVVLFSWPLADLGVMWFYNLKQSVEDTHQAKSDILFVVSSITFCIILLTAIGYLLSSGPTINLSLMLLFGLGALFVDLICLISAFKLYGRSVLDKAIFKVSIGARALVVVSIIMRRLITL
ncbi:MAG: hypothetical protein Q7S27_02610 [Nanoarchaeota archaeon]|nr:hypothetical protein [Nanoarchaeota archaeon]